MTIDLDGMVADYRGDGYCFCNSADKYPLTSLCRIRKRGNNMDSTADLTAGLSANFHLIEACNAHCKYCFATFPRLQKENRLSTADRKKLVELGVR